jgi:hypothetical protein
MPLKHKHKFTPQESKQIDDADEDMRRAVIGFILCKNGYKIGDGFEKGWIQDYVENSVEFGEDEEEYAT